MSKRIMAVVLVAVLAVFGGLSNEAIGAGNPTGGWSLSNGIDLPGFTYSYNTYSVNGEQVNFSAYMSNADLITNVETNVWVDETTPTFGRVNAIFLGVVGQPVVEMPFQSQDMQFNRHGINFYSFVGLSGSPDYKGDMLSNAWTSLSLAGVETTYASASYNEWTDDWSGVTYFNAHVQWQIAFPTPAAGLAYSGFGANSVPEPTTMSLLAGLGALGLLRRKRR